MLDSLIAQSIQYSDAVASAHRIPAQTIMGIRGHLSSRRGRTGKICVQEKILANSSGYVFGGWQPLERRVAATGAQRKWLGERPGRFMPEKQLAHPNIALPQVWLHSRIVARSQ
jgi:hypothetical protein